MSKQKSVGLTLFAVCCSIYVRTAFLAPTTKELQDPSLAERSRAFGAENDQLGLLHGLRYYILGVGVVGLLIVVEDYFMERPTKTKKPDDLEKVAGPEGAAGKPDRSGT